MLLKKSGINLVIYGIFAIFIFSGAQGVPLRGFGAVGGGAEDYCAGFVEAEKTDGYPGQYSRIIIKLRPERDPDWGCGNIASISFRLNYDSTKFTYNSIYKLPVISAWTSSVTIGSGYIDVTASGTGVSIPDSEQTEMLRVYFLVGAGTENGTEYPFTLSDVSVSPLAYIYTYDGSIFVTDSTLSVSAVDRSSVAKQTRFRIAVSGSGFSPYTEAKLEYNGSVGSPCQTIPSLAVENEGTGTLYAMFELPDTCTGVYNLWLGRRGGMFESSSTQPYQTVDSGYDITVTDTTDTSFFIDRTSVAGLSGIDDAYGIAVGDFNNTGFQDIYVCRASSDVLLRNNGDGTFSNMPGFGTGSTAATWADIDNDGDLDLMVDLKLYRNDISLGYGFSDITASAFPGIATGGDIHGMAWADYDNDGDIDVFLARSDDAYGYLDQLWRNNGSGVFTEVAASAGLQAYANQNTVGCAWGDYNNDGFMDLFLGNGPDFLMGIDDPCTNSLYSNNGNGTFTRLTNNELADNNSTASVIWVDANNDGWMDVHVTNVSYFFRGESEYDFFYMNNGDGTFDENSVQRGIKNNKNSFGASWADWDLNGQQTPLIATYDGWNQLNREVSAGISYTDDRARIISSGLPATTPSDSHTCAWLDYDNDGDMDYIMTGVATSSNLVLMQNRYRDLYPTKRYLEVNLQGVVSNSFGVGSRIEVFDGTKTMVRYITAGEGYLKQDGLAAHFGLGYISGLVDLTVYWPSGRISNLPDTAVDQILTVIEPYNVPDDYATIQAAINGVPEGSTITVDAGTYTEILDLGGKDIHLIGEYGPCNGETILDGGGTGTLVTIDSGETTACIIEGFVFQNAERGIYLNNSSATVTNCIFRNMSGSSGACIYGTYTNAVIVNSVFHDNYGSSSGAAMYMSYSSASIVNNIFWNNTSGNNYGAVRLFSSAGSSFVNNIVSENTGRGLTSDSGCPTVNYNDFWNNTVSNYLMVGCTAGANEISADPLMEDPAGGRFYLTSSSPCIGYGNNSATGLPTLDFEGDTRITGTNVDIGADEYACVTLAVPSSYGTIQEALDSSYRGDTILVSDGTYYENLVMPCHDVTLTSVNGQESSIINGGSAGSVISFDDYQSRYSVVEGFTITGGNAAYDGGGVRIYYASPTIRQNWIKGNAAANWGGAIMSRYAESLPLITNNIISGNTASYGGGIYVGASSSPTIVNNTFDGNSASTGGAIRLNTALNAQIHNNIISNHSTGYGIAASSSTATIDYNDFWSNSPSAITGLTATNSLALNPLYVSAGTNYHLQSSSPVIDAGSNAAPETPSVDMDDDSRPFDGNCDSVAVVDMGADEATYTPSAPGTGTINASDNETCDDTGVDIEWAAPSGGWGDYGFGTRYYEIYRGAVLIYTASEVETYYLDTAGTNNTLYTYKVTAFNGCGLTTDYSTDLGVDLVPSAPGSGSVTATDDDFCDDTGVNLFWAAPSGGWNDNTIGTRTYQIRRDGILIYTASSAATTYTDTTGDNNTIYTYQITAINGCGLTTVYSTDPATDRVPSNPDGGSVTSTDDDTCDYTGVNLSWAAPSGGWNDNSVGTRTFGIYRGAILIDTVPGTQTAYTDLLGDNDASYTYKVVAINGCGLATDYSTSDAGDMNSTPGAPVIVSIEDNDECAQDGVIITFTDSSEVFFDDMESGLNGWTIQSPGGNNLWHQVSEPTCSPSAFSGSSSWYFGIDGACNFDNGSTVTGNIDTPVISNLPPLSYLKFQYRKISECGGGCCTYDKAYVQISVDGGVFSTIAEICDSSSWSQYPDIDLSSYSGRNIVLRFNFNSIDNVGNTYLGLMIDDVKVFTATDFNLLVDSIETVTGITSPYTYSPGDSTSHVYGVRAISGTCMTDSLTSSATDIDNSPDVPVITGIVDNNDCVQNGVAITFTGSAPGFNLIVDTVEVATGITSPYTYNPGDTANHDYIVRAVNGSCSTDSLPTSAADLAASAPGSGSVTAVDNDFCADTGVGLSWAAPSGGWNDNGAGSRSFEIYRSGILLDTVPEAQTTYTDLLGDNNTVYSYYLYAINGCGLDIDYSASDAADNVASAPGGGSLTAVDNDDCLDTGVHLSWAVPSGGWNDNGVGTRGFQVWRQTIHVTTLPEGTTDYDDITGPNNAIYTYKIVAVNGCGIEIVYATDVAGDLVASNPGSGSVTAVDDDFCADTGVDLTWTAPSNWNDRGVGTRTYEIYRDALIIDTIAEGQTTYTDLLGDNNTLYTYKIVAINGCGLTTDYATDLGGDAVASAPGGGAVAAADASGVLYSGNYLSWAAPAGGWNDNTAGTRSFEIYRDTVLIDTVSSAIFEYLDVTASPEFLHAYEIHAVNGCGLTSIYSGSSSTDTAVEPGNLTALNSGGDIILNWSSVSGADRYHVYMGTLGSWYSHDNFSAAGLDNDGVDGSCNEPSNSAAFEVPAGNVYFLIAAGEAEGEGLLGQNSLTVDRPAALSPCQP